jgi:hypothetical protein
MIEEQFHGLPKVPAMNRPDQPLRILHVTDNPDSQRDCLSVSECRACLNQNVSGFFQNPFATSMVTTLLGTATLHEAMSGRDAVPNASRRGRIQSGAACALE